MKDRGEGRGARGEGGGESLRGLVFRNGCFFALAVFALVTILGADAAHAAEPAGALATIESIRIGFGGRYKVGFWTPIDISLTGNAKSSAGSSVRIDLQVIVPDGDGVPTTTVEHGIALTSGKSTLVRTCVKIGRPLSSVTVVAIAEDNPKDKVERTFSGDAVATALPATQRLILELGGSLNLGSVVRFNEEGQPEDSVVAVVKDPTSLPDRWLAYEGVDIAVLTTADPAYYLRAPRPSLAALHRWVRLGGRLLLSVGDHGPELLAAGKPLEAFVPGKFVTTVQLSQFESLENFAGASQRLEEGVAPGNRLTLPVAKLAEVRGQREAFEGNGSDLLPLVVRSADAFGELNFVAVDLNSSPLSRWQALPQLMAALLGRSMAEGQSPPAPGGAVHLGYNDMSGQLRTAIDQFAGVRMTPFWLITLLAGGYVFLLFPLDYWLKRRKTASANSIGGISGSAGWPWLSFGVIAVGVSLGAWWIARQSHGEHVEIDQADVIDFDVDSGLARGTTWFSLFSPRNAQYSLSLQPIWHGSHAEQSPAHLSWLGLPGNALGGMGDGSLSGSGGFSAGAAADLPLFTEPYSLSNGEFRARPSGDGSANNPASIGPVPIAPAASKCFTGQWINESASLVAADLQERPDHQLVGTIRMPENESANGSAGRRVGSESLGNGAGQGSGRADLQLTDCVLIHDRWAYLIPHFSPSEPIDVASIDPETADTYFTRRRIVGDQVQTPLYDRTGTDRARILEIMMFYRAAGGLQYVGLLNRYEHFLDLSGHLSLNRAILIGIGPPASDVSVDGQPIAADASAEHLTYYRFLLPVRATDSAGQPSPGDSVP